MKKQKKYEPNLGLQEKKFEKAEQLLQRVANRQKVGWNKTAEEIAKREFQEE